MRPVAGAQLSLIDRRSTTFTQESIVNQILKTHRGLMESRETTKQAGARPSLTRKY
jgi:hypothetical protein